MSNALITGTPGAGKTLYCLAEFVPGWLADLVSDTGEVVKRRLVAGNIRDLLLDHELIEVPRIRDWDAWYKDPVVAKWIGVQRLPADPPVPGAPMRADLWWLWCRPGDVIVIDEAQHVFKPMAAGRALPPHITNLEEHRHYGVDFVFITQHGNLLHANVRALINPHLHVRRLFGRSAALIYEFDACTNPKSVSQALSKKVWKYSKKTFEIYRSSELHTKQARGIPWQIWAFLIAVLAIPFLIWNATRRADRMLSGGAPSAAASAPAGPASAVAPGAWPALPAGGQRVVPRGRPAFVGVVAERETWPDIVAGCWQADDECHCMTQEQPPRVVSDRPALCYAVMQGHLVPPDTHAAPVRAPEASGPARPASGPMVAA